MEPCAGVRHGEYGDVDAAGHGHVHHADLGASTRKHRDLRVVCQRRAAHSQVGEFSACLGKNPGLFVAQIVGSGV